MNRFRTITAVTLLTGALASGAVFAQDQGQRRGGPGRGGFDAGLPLRELDLTEAQRQQVQQITERHRTQLRADIMAVLTPAQRDQAAKLSAERQNRRQ